MCCEELTMTGLGMSARVELRPVHVGKQVNHRTHRTVDRTLAAPEVWRPTPGFDQVERERHLREYEERYFILCELELLGGEEAVGSHSLFENTETLERAVKAA